MLKDLVKYWWVFALQGVLAIGVGVAAFLAPGPTLGAFIALFAAYAIVTGILAIIAGLSVQNAPRWSLVIGGVLGIVVGALTIAQPDKTAVAVALLVGVYAIVTGVAQVAAAFTMRTMTNTFWLGLSGLVSVLFGVFLIAAPGDGVLAILWLIGFYAIVVGILLIAVGIRLRAAAKDVAALEATIDRALGSSTTTSAGSSGSSS